MGKKTKNGKQLPGNRLYAFSYAVSSMRAYPFRALSLALTLSLGVSLIGSVLIWADTGVQVSVDDYFDNNAFQMLLKNPAGQTPALASAQTYMTNSPLIDSAYRVNSTVGLVFGTQLPDDTEYGINQPLYTDGMKDCEVIVVSNEFLDIAKTQFRIEGDFQLNPGETLVSTQFVNYVYEVFGLTLTINSTLDVEVLTRRPTGQTGLLEDLGRTSMKSLRIVGIYEIEGYNSLIEIAFESMMRNNYVYIHYYQPVLGIRDSIMVLPNEFPSSALSQTGFFGPRSFLRASSQNLIAAGVDSMDENLLTLKARVDEGYDVTVEGLGEILYLQSIVDTYVETMPLVLLNLPIFILALFLSVFAADTFMATRNIEVSALRSKGSSSNQVYGIFFAESVVIAAFSTIAGVILSILFAALIPSATGFMMFDWEMYNFFLANTVLKPESIVMSILLCIVPPLLFILNSARKAAMTEIGMQLMEVSEPISQGGEAYGFTIGASIVLLAMVVGSVLFLPSNPIMLLLELGLGTAAWFFMAYNGSRFSRVGFARITSKMSFVLGEKNLISAGNLRMRKGRIVPLMVVLALTMSSTIAFTVQADSFKADLDKEIRYAVGADLRVSTTPRPFSFNETIEEYPGVNRATPILRTWGGIGTERVTLAGIDAIEYSLIGNFDDSSFPGQEASFILSRLAATPDGILLSQYHANRWNKSIGDSINLNVGGRLSSVLITFTVVGIVYSSPGFGYASAEDIPPARLGAGFGFQVGYSGLALANIDYVSEFTDISSATMFLADLVCVTNQEMVLRALRDITGVSATTPETFDLTGFSFGTALFLSTIEGLFSIGFAMSLILSMFALTLFLGSIVRERKRDYAILRAVGGSKQQIVRVVLSEFTGIVFASLTLSLVLGTLFGYVMSTIIFSMSPFARTLAAFITFPIGFLTIVLLVEIIAMIAGAYIPAKEASKTDPAIVLRNL
ncbi:MAG: FtsX-like permease family protein [Candidatus Thorarchaeota archaeon]